MQTYTDYIKNRTAQLRGCHSENPIHQEHIVEFQQMAAAMID